MNIRDATARCWMSSDLFARLTTSTNPGTAVDLGQKLDRARIQEFHALSSGALIGQEWVATPANLMSQWELVSKNKLIEEAKSLDPRKDQQGGSTGARAAWRGTQGSNPDRG